MASAHSIVTDTLITIASGLHPRKQNTSPGRKNAALRELR